MFTWVANEGKYKRAYAKSLTKDEEDIKKIYVSLGGLVKEQPKKAKKKNVK